MLFYDIIIAIIPQGVILMKTREMIIDKNCFIDLVKRNNLNPIEVVPDAKLSIKMTCDEDTFLHTVSGKSPDVFYFYEYPKDHEILITSDTFLYANRRLADLIGELEISEEFQWELDREIYPDSDIYDEDDDDDKEIDAPYKPTAFERRIKKDILAYNAQIDRESLYIPRRFMAFYIDCGCLIGIYREKETPSWSAAEENLYSILSLHKDIVEQKMEAKEQHKNDIREKLKEHLKQDVQFKISTNKKLRVEYARNLWNNKEFKWIREGFTVYRGGYPSDEYFNFIDRVFNEIKYFKT